MATYRQEIIDQWGDKKVLQTMNRDVAIKRMRKYREEGCTVLSYRLRLIEALSHDPDKDTEIAKLERAK